jgi:hypothetical protein
MSNITFFDNLCEPFVFGPFDNEGAFLTLCFLDLILVTANILLLCTFGLFRFVKVYRKENLYQSHSKIHFLVISLSSFEVLLSLGQIIYNVVFYTDDSLPYFKFYLLCGLLVTWLFSTIVVELEYTRGLKYGFTTIVFWIISAFVNSLRVQAYYSENQLEKSFYFVLFELIICIILCGIALFANKSHPKSTMLISEDEDYYR